MNHPHHPIAQLCKYFFILLLISSPLASYAEMDHSHHEMDHSHHMAMMKNQDKGFKLSNENFELTDIELITSTGDKTTLLKELNTTDPVILNFIFTTCTAICPIMSGTFAQVNKKLNNKSVKMISISIDPEFDTPKTLQAYAKKFNANKKWHFYTGSVNNIINIQTSFSDYRGNKMNHEPSTYIRPAKKSKWLKISGFISAKEIVKLYNKNN